MTNIMAFTVTYGDKGDAVYVCSDSQLSNEREKGRVQKLFLRGGNFVTSTGTAQRMGQTIDSLDDVNEIVKPSYIADRVFEGGKKFSFRKRRKGEPEDSQGYIVTGLEDGKPVIYSVHLSRETCGPKPLMSPITKQPNCFKGSGSSQTLPAIRRDYETGNLGLSDLAEGLVVCFSLGNKAKDDMYVDDRLQIGLMTKDFTRMLKHHDVNFHSEKDLSGFMNANTGLSLTEKDFSENPEAVNLWVIYNDLYTDMAISCARVSAEDISVNTLNTNSKADKKNRKKHEKERQHALERRDTKKAKLSGLVGSWVSGDAGTIADSLKKYNRKREDLHSSGAVFAKNKGGFGTPKK